MKTYTQLLNELELETKRRATGARMIRTLSNPSQAGIAQSAKNHYYVDKAEKGMPGTDKWRDSSGEKVRDVQVRQGAEHETNRLAREEPYRHRQLIRNASNPKMIDHLGNRTEKARKLIDIKKSKSPWTMNVKFKSTAKNPKTGKGYNTKGGKKK
tara:strand:- start:533 stop:997 length:465 start_codon:yes stop_codon:yes gene_type:complete